MSNSILFISPYRHLAQTARHVIASMGLKKIPAEISYDYQALKVLKNYPDVKIVISRGGTLKFLGGRTDLALVNIGSSIFDLMEALEVLTKNGCKKIAVVTQDNIQGLKSGTINLSGIEISLSLVLVPMIL